jgi:hypothetical protein
VSQQSDTQEIERNVCGKRKGWEQDPFAFRAGERRKRSGSVASIRTEDDSPLDKAPLWQPSSKNRKENNEGTLSPVHQPPVRAQLELFMVNHATPLDSHALQVLGKRILTSKYNPLKSP